MIIPQVIHCLKKNCFFSGGITELLKKIYKSHILVVVGVIPQEFTPKYELIIGTRKIRAKERERERERGGGRAKEKESNSNLQLWVSVLW